MPTISTALIIGGGIAGPLTALALRRAGIAATVFEGYDGTADGVGGMLGIAPNGLAALGVLGADGPLLRVAEPVSAMVMHSWTGKRLATFGGDGEPIMHTVWRADLYRVLHDLTRSAGIEVRHGKRLTAVTEAGDGVTAHFADGSSATGDILVGADGIRSTVRALVDPANPAPRFTGLLGFGARPRTGVALPADGALHMTYGRRAFFAYGADAAGRAGWFANLPARQPMDLTEARALGAHHWLEVLRETFAADRTPAPALLAQACPQDLVIVGALEDLPRVPTWSRDRLVLVGDAAHATSPSSGQGVSIAVESAIQLARCLRDLPSVPDAFAGYERLRRARVERVIAAGARTSSGKAAGPVARVLRDALMPLTMRMLAKPEKMAWQYGYRIDWAAPVT